MSSERSSGRTLFEVSWEVCNMVGGIHTVLVTKLADMRARYGDDYVTIGPDIAHMVHAPSVFEEELWDPRLLLLLADTGVHVRMGRWRTPERPRTLLVNYSDLYQRKDRILARYWERYKLDSLFGGWDYHDPLLFGHAAGMVIERYYTQLIMPARRDAVVHCHEWTAAAAILHLQEHVPEIGTVFTTHATTLGRALSAQQRRPGLELGQNPYQLARELDCTAKHSLETVTAEVSDVFTTVSELSAQECTVLLGRMPRPILPNGLGEAFPGPVLGAPEARTRARELLFELAERVTLDRYDREATVLVVSSGRYEYVNKGIDVFLRALARLRERLGGDGVARVVAFGLFPGGHAGPRRALSSTVREERRGPETCTHDLRDFEHDPIQRELAALSLRNEPASAVHFIHVPITLSGTDALIPASYYELLPGFDLSVFPSRYEPWGYTPHEAIAFGVPSVTSDLAGFGRWVEKHGAFADSGVHVLKRDNESTEQVVEALGAFMDELVRKRPDQRAELADRARATSSRARWRDLVEGYFAAHATASGRAAERGRHMPRDRYSELAQKRVLVTSTLGGDVTAHMRPFVVANELPEPLAPLRAIARNLAWSWHPEARTLFEELDEACWALHRGLGPLGFLERVPAARLAERALDADYVARVRRLAAELDDHVKSAKEAQIAYFCMEFGLESHLHLYSGGLGILAGDHLKTASDMNLPLCAVGLGYQTGYFRQHIDRHGRQESLPDPNDFAQLGCELVRNAAGNPLIIELPFPGREVRVRAWKLMVGRIALYLLDTQHELNRAEDRAITDRLYGGDQTMRLSQELVLGVGGHRLLEAMAASTGRPMPCVFHMNEGHSTFLVLARLVHHIQRDGLRFEEALDYVRHTTIFTSHTPVPAGHDRFDEALARPYLSPFESALRIGWTELLALGKPVERHVPADKFGTTELAMRGSLRINGVSKIHGDVMRRMFREAFPGYHPEEIPIGSITNGVHVPTWVTPDIQALIARAAGDDYRDKLADPGAFEAVRDIPSAELWQVHQERRRVLLDWLEQHIQKTWYARRVPSDKITRACEVFDDEPLIIGFARRFAPYKRADMLFGDIERLNQILFSERPVIVVYGGKAHPRDSHGQELLRRIVDLSLSPRLLGRVFVVENYDMDVARMLVSGCDVWLNTPTRPLEASGTSGMKAAMNGCLNLSVPDGWWAECANGQNGWVIGDDDWQVEPEVQSSYDAHALYGLLENDVLPTFEQRGEHGIPESWVRMMKESIATSIAHFSSRRMLGEYLAQYYTPALLQGHGLRENDFRALYELRATKRHLITSWPAVEFSDVRIEGLIGDRVVLGRPLEVQAELRHPGLDPALLDVQLVVAHGPVTGKLERFAAVVMKMNEARPEPEKSRWRGRFDCTEAGPHALGLRVVPRGVHAEGDVELELDLVRWL
jgi:phosphorylase/glycogen(starch) synthase